MQNKVSTFLWFESSAAEAAELYCSIFPVSKITSSSPMSTTFEIEGQRFIAFNGGSHYKLDPSISLFVSCNSQEEVDALWNRFLADGGKESKCGWLTDKFGLSWQIIPTQLMELMSDPDPVVANRVMQAMLAMQKIDIAALQAAHRG
ncbi:MAG: VOC family protein [Myxococcota bacterium]|nr:VOC family protein [Myxococcota bacterium]